MSKLETFFPSWKKKNEIDLTQRYKAFVKKGVFKDNFDIRGMPNYQDWCREQHDNLMREVSKDV